MLNENVWKYLGNKTNQRGQQIEFEEKIPKRCLLAPKPLRTEDPADRRESNTRQVWAACSPRLSDRLAGSCRSTAAFWLLEPHLTWLWGQATVNWWESLAPMFAAPLGPLPSRTLADFAPSQSEVSDFSFSILYPLFSSFIINKNTD